MEKHTGSLGTASKYLKSTQIFIVAAIILLTVFITVLCVGFTMRYEVDTDVSNVESISYWKDALPAEQQLWYEKGIEELKEALNRNKQEQPARNVIIFAGHGISPAALAAARFSETGHTAKQMSWEPFPHLGRLKNSCSSLDVCDAFTAATALFGGIGTNFKIGGLDGTIRLRDCAAAANESHHIKSVLQLAQEIGLRTGFVTTRRVTASTTASLYAHTPDTSWECDATMPKGDLKKTCRDIAQQLVKGKTGRQLNVIMGGGRQALVARVPTTKWDIIDNTACNSDDGRNLIRDWQKQKLQKRHSYAVLQNMNELRRLNGSAVDYVLGIYANGGLEADSKQDKIRPPDTIVDLVEMVRKSMAVLSRKGSGYMLVVEAGITDQSDIKGQIRALQQLNAAIEDTLNSSNRIADSLCLVVFTHGGSTTSAETEIAVSFQDIADDDSVLQQRFQNIFTDTVIYANGPKSHLFHGVHEDTYMAHVISYALKMGWFKTPKKS